jgi:hypothetical protein
MRLKYVLCRPDGGSNDTLKQIAFVHTYARQTGRIAIIDTAYEKMLHFHNKVFKLFFEQRSKFDLGFRFYQTFRRYNGCYAA